MNTWNTIASSYHSKDRSFTPVWVMEFSIISPCLGKNKKCSNNSNLTNFLYVQILHDNGKLIIFTSNNVIPCLKKRSCCSALLYYNASFTAQLKLMNHDISMVG